MSTPSNPPAAVAMTRVKVSKGATTTDLSSKLAVDVPADKKTASDLRVSLAAEGFMKNTDVFLTSPDNFPLSKGSEPNTQWSTLVAADGSIGVLTPPAKTAENLALPPLPTSKDFWDPKLGGGTLLPTLPTTRVGEAQSISELKNAADLGIEEWLYLIKLNGLFGGIRLGDATAAEDPGPVTSPYLLIQPPQSIMWSVDDPATVEVVTLTSERNTSYARQGWVKAAATFTTPYASASVEASHQEMRSKETSEQKIYVTGTYNYKRATLEFDPDSLKLSDAFMGSLNKALAHQTDSEKLDALRELFRRYGHVFALRVTLGGLLVMTKTSILSGTKESKETEDEVKASISSVIGGIGASASVATGTKVSEMESEKKGFSSDAYNVKGGDTTLATSVDKWISTVGPFKNWRVIQTEKVIAIQDLIPEPQRSEVIRLAPRPKPLKASWVYTTTHFTDAGSRADMDLVVSSPNIPVSDNRQTPWYWLGQTIGGTNGGQALVVQETWPGALCPMQSTETVWDNGGGKGDAECYLGHPIPKNPVGFVTLGSFFYNMEGRGRQPPGLTDDVFKYPKLMAVRKDLVVPARVQEPNTWNDHGSGSDRDGSVWQIVPNDDKGISLGQFVAHNGYDKPSRPVWTLRQDAVDWL
ncbi:hypothetical protein CPB86DRAFT_820185 [Serendipita vermifera]|nr:hypothetical protein CPB86DRAFT_820185 [Serendipita vermifera]